MKINEHDNSTPTNKKSPSWLLVIFLLFIFWPVGIFFLVKKLSADKQASLTSGKKTVVWGWIIFSIGALGSCGMLDQRTLDGASGTLFFVFAGLALVFVGKMSAKKAVKFKKYIKLIVNEGLRSIPSIAAAIPATADEATEDIQEMIKKGFFMDAYINFSTNKLVFIREENQVESNLMTSQLIVSCNGCGANNKVASGQVSKCQYCGSLISGQ